MCFDNRFGTLPLLLKMKFFGILTTATIRANRFSVCPLKAEKDWKNEGHGSLSFRTDANSGVMLLRWFDKNLVQLASILLQQLALLHCKIVGMQKQKSTPKYLAQKL